MLKMPRRSRGRGFKHTKAGRFHAEQGGGGRGTRGRKKSSSDVLVGESPDESFSPPSVSSVDDAESIVDSEESNSSSAFMRALSPLAHSSCSLDMRSSPDVVSTMFSDALKLLISVVPKHWTVIQGQKGFHVLCLSKSCENISIQREVFAEFSGVVKVFVHRKEVSLSLFDEDVKEVSDVVPLTDQSLRVFVDKVLHVVLAVRSYEICAGADSLKFQDSWSDDTSGDIDLNPYDESRYSVTFRSRSCALLVPIQLWRCSECSKAVDRLRVRSKSHGSEEAHPNTRNTYLDEKQKMQQLKSQRNELKKAKRKIDYLSSRVSALITQEGVTPDKDIGEDLTNILRESKLTPIQQLFIEQQYKSSLCKNTRGMRWHATMIRFALLIKSTSTAAFAAIQSAGVIRLPSDRTLFDYSNAIPRSEGVFKEKLDVIGKKVSEYEDEHQHYHSLLMDEIYISQKLVYRKSDASLVGYVKLNEVETEIQTLVDSINNGMVKSEPTVASKVLAYMVKGCTNSVKEVVAAFTPASLTKEQLFDKSWSVISSCEKVGVKVLALVCDGSSVNRSFIGMHTPATPSTNGVVFDSVNLCAPDRNIFFSDPPHLLKTIRNCFAKSGYGKRCTRLLTIGGQHIVWKTIERLYTEDARNTLRRCFKLTSQNVYLNSYTCMKVAYAAQILSRTVAMDLKDRDWPGVAATVLFILKVNNFFDCLNGAHTNMGTKKANSRLAPYRDVNDERFGELKSFEKYLLEWGEEINNLKGVSSAQKSKIMLSAQTLQGIYMTINAFCGAMKFLLDPTIGAKFVNARAVLSGPSRAILWKAASQWGWQEQPHS